MVLQHPTALCNSTSTLSGGTYMATSRTQRTSPSLVNTHAKRSMPHDVVSPGQRQPNLYNNNYNDQQQQQQPLNHQQLPTNNHSNIMINNNSYSLATCSAPQQVTRRKPGSTENTGRWSADEHQCFLDGYQKHGKEWKLIGDLIETRTVVQIRTHAQKYFQKIAKTIHGDGREAPQGLTSTASTSRIPVPRPSKAKAKTPVNIDVPLAVAQQTSGNYNATETISTAPLTTGTIVMQPYAKQEQQQHVMVNGSAVDTNPRTIVTALGTRPRPIDSASTVTLARRPSSRRKSTIAKAEQQKEEQQHHLFATPALPRRVMHNEISSQGLKVSAFSPKIDIAAIGGAQRSRSRNNNNNNNNNCNLHLKWTDAHANGVPMIPGASPTSVADFALFEFGAADEDNDNDSINVDIHVDVDELTQDEVGEEGEGADEEDDDDTMSDSDDDSGTPTGRGSRARGDLTSPFPVLNFKYAEEEGEEDKYSGSVGSEEDCILSPYDCSDTASIASDCITSEWVSFSDEFPATMSAMASSNVNTNVEPLPELSERSLADWVSHSLDAQM